MRAAATSLGIDAHTAAATSKVQLEAILERRVGLAVGRELRAVEESLECLKESRVALLRAMGEHSGGGKRLRPMLLLLAARVAGGAGPRAIRMGCVVELLHTATLIHDDVVDGAAQRRGRPSANARWGEDAAILYGDHLYARSLAPMLEDGDPAVMAALAQATVAMTEAEVFQLECKRSGGLAEADYLRIATQKTASFMAACCRIGALLGNAASERVEGLADYGLHLGIAFQICDDALDFGNDGTRLGKPIAADLRGGKWTLPLLVMLERATRAESERARALLSHGRAAESVREIQRLVGKYRGVDAAFERARAYAESAKHALRVFDDGEDRETLCVLADFAVRRDH